MNPSDAVKRAGRTALAVGAVALVGLAPAACGGSDSKADAKATETTTADATTDTAKATATTTDAAEETGADVSLEDAATVFIDYMDGYWGADSDKEKANSTAWAALYAGYHATLDQSTDGAAQGQEAHVDLHLDSIEESGAGYDVTGDITVTSAGVTYTYTDLFLVDDPSDGLLVADYCRTSSDGQGPLDGCLSSAVGTIAGSYTADDGSFEVSMGPMVRSLGYGAQYVDFTMCLTGTTSGVSVLGGLQSSFVVGTDINGMPADGVHIAPATVGGRSCGYLSFNPPSAATDSAFPAGEAHITLKKDDGSTVAIVVKTPSLPEGISDI